MHDENVKRLQDWIALPSIAAENRNYPQGPEYMAQLARDAGFANVEIVPTSGKPGVFGTLDAGARTTVGIYFMYDVKQFDPSEWSSPPLEGRMVDKEGLGKVCVGRGAVNQMCIRDRDCTGPGSFPRMEFRENSRGNAAMLIFTFGSAPTKGEPCLLRKHLFHLPVASALHWKEREK